jgi:hypothetical protein
MAADITDKTAVGIGIALFASNKGTGTPQNGQCVCYTAAIFHVPVTGRSAVSFRNALSNPGVQNGLCLPHCAAINANIPLSIQF